MSAPRTQPGVVVTVPTPAISDGNPVLPAYWARLTGSATLIQGPKHIHAIKDPNPIWDPRTSGWFYPPPPVAGHPSVGHASWAASDLPSPASAPGGYYWLGDPSSQDGTAGITAKARQWAPRASNPGAPAWRSFFPFKPSVTAVDHYLQGGGIVHHPVGVNFNSHFIEHMWMSWAADHRQPFTWVIVACATSYPTSTYEHHLLGAGRNPDEVGFPRISAEQCGTPRRIADGLPYSTLLGVDPAYMQLATAVPGGLMRARSNASLRPKMFVGIFNGANSYLGAWYPGYYALSHGRVTNSSAYRHRHYVLGRAQNWISQTTSGHLMVFEMRFWDEALTGDDLRAQYHQLASTYQFARYNGV